MTVISRLHGRQVTKHSVVPLAMIGISVRRFEQEYSISFDREHDDFDNYSAVYLNVDGHFAALKRYDGEEHEGITIYLEVGLTEDGANRIINAVLNNYGLSEEHISWRETFPYPGKVTPSQKSG